MTGILTVHYHRFSGGYDGWALWVWPGRGGDKAREIPCAGQDSFGAIFLITLDSLGCPSLLGLLPKFKEWADKDGPDRWWRPDLPAEVFIIEGDDSVYTAMPSRQAQPRLACIDSRTLVSLRFNVPLAAAEATTASLEFLQDDTPVPIEAITPYSLAHGCARAFLVRIPDVLDLEKLRTGALSIRFNGSSFGCVMPRYILDDPYFSCALPLGPYVDAQHLFLRVWAPAARELRAVLGREPPLPPASPVADPAVGAHSMDYKGRGVWELKCFGDFRGWHYRLDALLTHQPDSVVSVRDPYGRAIDRRHGTCILISDATPVADPPRFPFSDAIIYELHVRDFTNDPASGVAASGSFAGLAQEGSRLRADPTLPTGFDHLRALGVNTIQLMPVHAFELDEDSTRHAWGYMPIHYNAPEPAYASDDSGVSAVAELKQAIGRLHAAGFKVVLDVVYNHSTEGPHHAAHWNGLAPEYFYRVRPDGLYWNGSGCGNEFRPEGPMALTFLLDSLTYWLDAYKVDGFRLDLMGLFDRSTMAAVVSTLRARRPDVFIYGEPWTGGESPIMPTTKGDQRSAGFSCFNDLYRNALAGNVFNDSPGYLLDGHGRHDIRIGWCGSLDWFTDAPHESINYVECHDNRTLFDRIAAVAHAVAPGIGPDDQLAANRIAAFLVVLAQGVPFLHSGQEFARTKCNVGNSYNLGDAVNNIHWQRKAEMAALCSYYAGLCRIRAAHPLFRLGSRDEVERRLFWGVLRAPYLECEIDGTGLDDPWRRVVAIVNPTGAPVRCAVPDSAHGWQIHVSGAHAGTEPLAVMPPLHQTVEVAPRSALLLAEPARS